jgi:hypothetical protein
MGTFSKLWQGFQQALPEPTGDLANAICALPDVCCLSFRWANWSSIRLVRHRRRQL